MISSYVYIKGSDINALYEYMASRGCTYQWRFIGTRNGITAQECRYGYQFDNIDDLIIVKLLFGGQ